MSMLAEPKRRKRYNLVPKGKALYEDENRFGTKMLEKMGWERGKGLGAREEGSKDFVRIRYKNDSLGLGFEHRDDQWTQHEESFNGLLKTLNNEENKAEDSNIKEDNGSMSEEDMPRIGFGFQSASAKEQAKSKVEKLKEKISGISLEERSKQSKARVHYKKFTKGKDLSQYSEKDLANIFGKKADLLQEANKSPATQISTGISVNEYFQSKMRALNNHSDFDSTKNNMYKEIYSKTEHLEEDITNKKGKDNQSNEWENVEGTEKKGGDEQMTYSSMSVNDYFKMKMEVIKERKSFKNAENIVESKTCEVRKDNEVSKKNKKNKNVSKDQETIDELHHDVEIIEYKKSKTSKYNADTKIDNNEKEKVVETGKKREKKSKKTDEGVESVNLSLEEEIKKEKHKSKKRKHEEIEPQTAICNENLARKDIQNENSPIDNSRQSEETKTKKKKCKSKEKTPQTEISKENLPRKNIQNCNSLTENTSQLDATNEFDSKEEPPKKKIETIDVNEIIEIEDSDTEIKTISENEHSSIKKKKSKKSKKSVKISEMRDASFCTKQTEKASANPLENHSKKVKRKVSFSAKNAFVNGINTQVLDANELKQKYNAFNIYPISSFCAEKFRNISLNDFTGSILPQIEGYGLGPELQLEVQINKKDEERITNLWKGVLNKYDNFQKSKKTYQHYVRGVIKARKTKQKTPKLYVKTWKRKNVFQII